jgi:hypothetical protein
MDDDAQEAAWHRIGAALDRLETAARGNQGALRDEQARHAALRQALRETLGRMDALIAAHTSQEDAR